jgi:hypothetical protein
MRCSEPGRCALVAIHAFASARRPFHAMPASAAYLAAELRGWPSKEHMASILRAAGLRISVGHYSIRLNDFSNFIFAEYGGDLGEPSIEADASSPEALAWEAQRVSSALSAAGVVHRFEIYSEDDEEIRHYFHHAWPQAQ